MTPRAPARLALAGLCLLLAILLPNLAWAEGPKTVRFGGGSPTGGFTATGEALAGAVEELDADIRLEVLHTGGSCDNVRKLARGEVDAAMVQYDVAAEAFSAAAAAEQGEGVAELGAEDQSGWMCGLRADELAGVELELVAAVYDSAVHVIVRRPVRLDNFNAIGDRPIYIGKQGSGSMETSKVILGAAGLTVDDVNFLNMGTSASMERMRAGELLMMLRTTGVGDAKITGLLASGVAEINPLPAGVIERLITGFPHYRTCQIDAHSYPGLDFGTPTVCVSTVVLTAKRGGEQSLSDGDVAELITALRHLEDNGTPDKAPDISLAWHGFAEREPVPLHPEAERRDHDRQRADPGVIRFGGGSAKGGFTRTANALATGLEATGADLDFRVRHTGGSCDNVRKLARGELEAALVQYDVAAEAFSASAAFSQAQAEAEGEGEDGAKQDSGWMCGLTADEIQSVELELVAAINDSAVHMIVRRPVRLDDFSAIGERPIFVGRKGSGSMETSKVILGAAGLTIDDVHARDIGTSASFEEMRAGELLMMLRTTGVGDGRISDLIATGMADLNPLPGSMIERLIDGFPYYRVCQIDAGSYPGLEFGVPTVCVSTVVLTVSREGEQALSDEQVEALIGGLRWLEDNPQEGVDVEVRWRGFAEREPVPLHPGAASVERWGFALYWTKILIIAGLGFALLALLRRYLRKKGVLGNPLSGNLEGQLSNPIVPFVGFLLIVGSATLVVWTLEHDSNARVRTLNDSFWEMNMFATGNFDSESLKTSTARVIGAAATIAGLGLLAWFTAALTAILSQDQMRLFRRLRNHIVILNFHEDMLQLIRVLRSPGPARQRSIHVVVSDSLPPRVRSQLTRVRGLTIYEQNPEVPEELVELRLPRAARVIVLQGAYHPLRIARAVHHACVRLDPKARAETVKRAELGLAPSVQSPALASEAGEGDSAVPVTLVEAAQNESDELFEPFERWLVPVPARSLADAWLANAALNPVFGEFFNDIVTFREDNSELYTVLVPESLHGKSWRELRKLLFTAESRAGIVPIGLYRGHRGKLAYAKDDVAESSPQEELARRLQVNPPLDLKVGPGDRLLAFAEDEADLRKVLKTR